MKLKRGSEKRIVYFDGGLNEHPREEVLAQVKGKPLSEGKQIAQRYTKKAALPWLDRDGSIVAWTYNPRIISVEIKPADVEERRADYLRRLREALDKVSQPGATPDDMAAALRLQLEYEQFKMMLED